MRDKFWERIPLNRMTQAEWEALCDGCGKCCLNKLEDADTGEVAFTRIACRLLDDENCQCAQYEIRKTLVPECVVLTPQTIEQVSYWMPSTCAYRRLAEKKRLPSWHYLIAGDKDLMHDSGESVRGWTVPEYEIEEDDWEDYVIEDL